MFKYSASVSLFRFLFIIIIYIKKLNNDICWIPIVHEKNMFFMLLAAVFFFFLSAVTNLE